MVSDHMLLIILSVSVEPLEMLCAEAADALAPWAGDSCPLHLMCVFKKLNFLNPVLPICHFLWSLTRQTVCGCCRTSPIGICSWPCP